jgi:hypothetical protein
MVLVVTLFLFNIYCGFSGTPVFEVLLLTFEHIFLTRIDASFVE